MAVKFLDQFVAPDFTYLVDHTPNVGTGWVRPTSWPQTPVFVQNDRVVSSHSNRPVLGGQHTGNYVHVTGVFDVGSIQTNRRFGVIAGFDDSTNEMYGCTHIEGQGFELWKRVVNQYGNVQQFQLASSNPSDMSSGLYLFNLIRGTDGTTLACTIARLAGGVFEYLNDNDEWESSGYSTPLLATGVTDLSDGYGGLWLTSSYLDSNGEVVTANPYSFYRLADNT